LPPIIAANLPVAIGKPSQYFVAGLLYHQHISFDFLFVCEKTEAKQTEKKTGR
jgi:hypothetical protein